MRRVLGSGRILSSQTGQGRIRHPLIARLVFVVVRAVQAQFWLQNCSSRVKRKRLPRRRAKPMGLTDQFGRTIDYLRLSVTDLCNLRCCYCMPAEGVPKLSHNDVLRFEELHRIAVQAVSLGVEKIRVTGGEPLVRKGIIPFLEKLAGIPGLRELALTTNGMLLLQLASGLRRAGVQRLNVSLDSLRADTFAAITRGGNLSVVWKGIRAAEDAGFPPPKINVVVMRGVNDNEILDFADLTLHEPYAVRFIEYMPTLMNTGWDVRSVKAPEILRILESRYPLQRLHHTHSAGPATEFRIPGAAGTLGIIAPLSMHFCGSCNRLRITASGMALGCLFSDSGIDLKPYLGQGDQDLREALRRAAENKPRQHRLMDKDPQFTPFAMVQIGG